MEKQQYICYTCQYAGAEINFNGQTNMLHCGHCHMPTLVMLYQGGIIGQHPAAHDLPLSKPMPPNGARGMAQRVNVRARQVADEQARLLIHETLRLMGYMVRHKLDGATYAADAVLVLRTANNYIHSREMPVDQRDEVVAYMQEHIGGDAPRALWTAGIETHVDTPARLMQNRQLMNVFKGLSKAGRPVKMKQPTIQTTGTLRMNIMQLSAPFTSSSTSMQTTRESVRNSIDKYIRQGYKSSCRYYLNGDIDIKIEGEYVFDKSTPAVAIRIIGKFTAGEKKRPGVVFQNAPAIISKRLNYTETWK